MLNREGVRYGHLTALTPNGKTKTSRAYRWLCVCDCGKMTDVAGGDLTSGSVISCGCLRGEVHDMKNSPEYGIWNGIINRCENPNRKSYKYYGEKGISVHESFRKSFLAFYNDVGERPSPLHQIDRRDNTRGYEPGNLRWVSCSVNNKNRSNSKWWHVDGVKYDSSTEAAEKLGVLKQTIIQWCNGYNARGMSYPPKPNCWSELKYVKS